MHAADVAPQSDDPTPVPVHSDAIEPEPVDSEDVLMPAEANSSQLPDGKGKRKITVATFSGPLPPPAVLEQYERTVPGCSERLLKLLEEQQAQNHAKERRGQLLAGGVAVLLVVGSVACAVVGATTIGCALAGATLVGAISQFLPKK